MATEVNDVVSVVTTVGEFIGKFVKENTHVVILKDPRMVVHGSTGMGFARGLSMASGEEADECTFYTTNVVFIAEAHKDVVTAYREFTSGLILK